MARRAGFVMITLSANASNGCSVKLRRSVCGAGYASCRLRKPPSGTWMALAGSPHPPRPLTGSESRKSGLFSTSAESVDVETRNERTKREIVKGDLTKGPIPIRGGAGETALGLHSTFYDRDIPTVPREEKAGAMDLTTVC